jgi:hypothetical protein
MVKDNYTAVPIHWALVETGAGVYPVKKRPTLFKNDYFKRARAVIYF